MYRMRMGTCLVNGRSGEAMIREYLLAPLYTRENAGWIRSIVLLFGQIICVHASYLGLGKKQESYAS